MNAARSDLRARLDLIGAALLFSTGGVCIKALGGLTAWQRAGLRSLIAALFLVLVWPQARRGYAWRSLAFSLFYAGTLACFVAANTWTTAANAIFLQSTAPLYVLLLSPLVLKERVRRTDVLFMVALAAGLALCFGGDLWSPGSSTQSTAPRPLLGNAFGIASGVMWAATLIGLRWLGRAQEGGAEGGGAGASVVSGNVVCFLLCLLIATFAGDGFGSGLAALDLKKISVLLFLGCFQVGLGYVFVARGMRRVPAMEGALLLLVEPVFNPVWSFLLLHERPGAWSLAGGAVILVATALHAPRAARTARTVPAA
jgi:DME family drug/metabolite transporter